MRFTSNKEGRSGRRLQLAGGAVAAMVGLSACGGGGGGTGGSGLGSPPYVQGGSANVRYLHDGPARTPTEAILWHGGEAEGSRTRFESLSQADRQAVLTFLNSL